MAKKRLELQEWKNVIALHILLGGGLLGVASASDILSRKDNDNREEDNRGVAFYFPAFVIGGLNITLAVLSGSYFRHASSNNHDRRKSQSRIGLYQLGNLIFWAFTIVSIVIAAVFGICSEDETCRYHKHYKKLKNLAISIIVMSAVSFLFALIMMDKTKLEKDALKTAPGSQGAATAGIIGPGDTPPRTRRALALKPRLADPNMPDQSTVGIYQTPMSAFHVPPPPSYDDVMTNSMYPPPPGDPHIANPHIANPSTVPGTARDTVGQFRPRPENTHSTLNSPPMAVASPDLGSID